MMKPVSAAVLLLMSLVPAPLYAQQPYNGYIMQPQFYLDFLNDGGTCGSAAQAASPSKKDAAPASDCTSCGGKTAPGEHRIPRIPVDMMLRDKFLNEYYKVKD